MFIQKQVLLRVVVCSIALAGYYVLIAQWQRERYPWLRLGGTAVRPGQRPLLFYRETPSTAGSSSSGMTFRILQIADIHLGEEEATEWGPEQDRKTWIALDRIIRAEGTANIDLIVLSGDQITANNIDANATAYYQELARRLSAYGIPFAMVMGNHEDLAFEYFGPGGKRQYRPAKTSRAQLIAALDVFPLSLTRSGPPQISGVSNYWLDIWYNETTVGSRIVLLDSGGGSLPIQITESQLNWFALTNQRNHHVPVVAFSHIPTEEFRTSQSVCRGDDSNGGVTPLDYDAGLVPALVEPENVYFLAVGHNHGNDYCCAISSSETLHLCYGRHSGYGGYGNWERGSRIYELELSNDKDDDDTSSSTTFAWKSYVRMESGAIQDEYESQY